MTLAAQPGTLMVPASAGAQAADAAPLGFAVQRREPTVRKWTREEYYQVARLGLFRERRVLLLGGEIIEMPGQGNWHSVTIGLVLDALERAFPRGQYWVRCQMPLDLSADSEPEPDVAVVPGKPTDYTAHPSVALLVVEVADSSLRLDRRKANAYAAAGVSDYWIVDIAGHQVEVYRNPVPDPREPFGHRYDQFQVLRPGATLTPLAAANAVVSLADLLPKQPVPDPDA